MNPSSAPGESPICVGGVASGGGGLGPPNTSISSPWSEGGGGDSAAVWSRQNGQGRQHKQN